MGMQLDSGTGKAYSAQVDAENRLHTFAVSEPLDHHINTVSGKVWSVPFENITNAGANDYIVYVKNTGSVDLYVTDVRVSASAATQMTINGVTGTAGGSPTSITAVSRTVGSSAAPTADLYSDPDITGLTSSGTLFFIDCPVADTVYHLRTSSNIVIPKSKAIGLLVETTTITTTGVISLVEAESV